MYINVYELRFVMDDEGGEECLFKYPERILICSHPTMYSYSEAEVVAARLERFLNQTNQTYPPQSVLHDYSYVCRAERTSAGQSIWAERACPYCHLPRCGVWHHWANIYMAHDCKRLQDRRKAWHVMGKVKHVSEIPIEDYHELFTEVIVEYLSVKEEKRGKAINIMLLFLDIPGVGKALAKYFEQDIINAYNKRRRGICST